MNVSVFFKNGQITERWNNVLYIERGAEDIVLLHDDGSETIYQSANVKRLATG